MDKIYLEITNAPKRFDSGSIKVKSIIQASSKTFFACWKIAQG